jgi:Protein of unknown function (DUF1761)
MQTFFTPMVIISATIAAFVVGSLWYSPILFLKPWLRGEGITKEQLPKRSTWYMISINLYSFVAHGAIASVLAIIFNLLTVSSMKVAVSLGLLLAFGFMVAPRFIDMIYTTNGKHYDVKSQIKFLVSSGYYLTIVAVISVTLFLGSTW